MEDKDKKQDHKIPTFIVAGLQGDAGKTLLSIGLVRAYTREFGFNVGAFKKGPDYIDAAWLSQAAGSKARNLDTFMMSQDMILHSFGRHNIDKDISIIEGNRGLFDGLDIKGTHSTAQLAKILNVPVLLVVNIVKVTRTAVAMVLGCQHLDPDIRLMGVILNRYSTLRHKKIVSDAIEEECHVPVLGAIPAFKDEQLLPDRHLGLITPAEHHTMTQTIETVASKIQQHCDLKKILTLARKSAPSRLSKITSPFEFQGHTSKQALKIGYFSDSAFTFYYPENLEILAREGVELVPISSLDAPELPVVHALYIGGGFPETHAAQLSGNQSLMASIRNAVQKGMPVYAECGGLIYLSRQLIYKGRVFPMAAVFPVTTIMKEKPQGHGYVIARVTRENPFFQVGTELKGHEFHYSTVVPAESEVDTAFEMLRGTGAYSGHDGLITKNVLATYIHLHALGTPQWAEALIRAAIQYKSSCQPAIKE
ncbi:cobyrinate a,c-diamide synthase [candidate division CSSED10-310 bacterium]|uniref:Cobyrinate a,c-diamide synthase n=1 Tax=candidate division CSSED10-310 bacterium TaxID=2855610 RepID=A0ABV6Z3A7_UNCC1